MTKQTTVADIYRDHIAECKLLLSAAHDPAWRADLEREIAEYEAKLARIDRRREKQTEE